MAHRREREYPGGVFVLPERSKEEKSRVKEAKRGGLLGADRAGTY
ncbi:MAG: hypothetical protein NWE91_00555 [Candidatus Bathyarchaeota archaeon]|nr:hypothetical protein [Candidatus Bathyarchaeota archaeon]